jgi:SPP1 family predicted phage head-tail adaptor
MRAGKLRHRIDIEEKKETQDETTGSMVDSWSPVFRDVPASISPLSVREFIASKSETSQIAARIVIRFREGLNAEMRIVHKGKIYNVHGWLPDDKTGREYLTAACSEGVNDG